MTTQDGSPHRSPRMSYADPSITNPKLRGLDNGYERNNRPFSEINLPFRRSNASLSALFASTSLSNTQKRASSPLIGALSRKPSTESGFSPQVFSKDVEGSNAYRDTIVRSFAPHVAILPSQDTEDLLAQKGFIGGLLQLLRPYGENVQGKVTIRDSTGASKSWEDYSIRFTRLKDGLEGPRIPERTSTDGRSKNVNGYMDEYFPASSARLRTGGDPGYVEDSVAKHLQFYESQFNADVDDELLQEMTAEDASTMASAFHLLYLRRLLSGLPVSPHETFSHPVACVVAVSSRNSDPVETLRQLQIESSSGGQRMPQWVNNDFLRYYVLVHDEGYDDMERSLGLLEQMKRHFGIHCHLLKIRSTQAVPSDDECVPLPTCEWLSAAEELAEIQRRETEDDMDTPGPFLFSSDEAALKSFVRELVTQSVIPVMERLCATWNDQVASRRRGIGGRFLSMSKKWSPFSSSNRNSSSPTTGPTTSSGSNYDSHHGFYRPDAPEAILRKLADYAFMLRDFKLAQSTYDLLRTDYQSDKAWKYYAGANEMSAISLLVGFQHLPSRGKGDTIDQMLDAACYSYITRCSSPYYALRTLAVGVELLALRGGTGADDAARWACRVSELELVGMVGHALFAQRVGASFASRRGTGSQGWGSRRRKSALWNVLATQDWVRMEKNKQAERCLTDVFKMYRVKPGGEMEGLPFGGMRETLGELRDRVTESKGTIEAFAGLEEGEGMSFEVGPAGGMEFEGEGVGGGEVEVERQRSREERRSEDKVDIKKHRTSLIGMSRGPSFAIEEQPQQQHGS